MAKRTTLFFSCSIITPQVEKATSVSLNLKTIEEQISTGTFTSYVCVCPSLALVWTDITGIARHVAQWSGVHESLCPAALYHLVLPPWPHVSVNTQGHCQ